MHASELTKPELRAKGGNESARGVLALPKPVAQSAVFLDMGSRRSDEVAVDRDEVAVAIARRCSSSSLIAQPNLRDPAPLCLPH